MVNEFPSWQKGIILVTGETGSGKSTTLAAMLDQINHTRQEHIITLEDPIEYVYTPDKCVINQREIGKDTESYDTGLKAILREDPDVILIGELRDLSTIEIALTAAAIWSSPPCTPTRRWTPSTELSACSRQHVSSRSVCSCPPPCGPSFPSSCW